MMYTYVNSGSAATPAPGSKKLSLQPVDVVDKIPTGNFRKYYFDKQRPLIIKDMAKSWPASRKWNWDHFKQILGNKSVGIYNNTKSDPYCPVNRPDDFTTFGEYINMIRQGPSEWRIFLFNIFKHAPHLANDFTWPDEYMQGFVKRFPMLFVGGAGSVTHMHFDMDLGHIFHTQFAGRKHVLLFPFEEQHKLYRKPFEVLSLADFTNYHDEEKSHVDLERFPALAKAKGFSAILEPGDTLFMPGGYWHHMEYIESGFAMSLRAMQESVAGKANTLWNLIGMRNIDTLMKKTMPMPWYQWKEKKIFECAARELQETYTPDRVSIPYAGQRLAGGI